jgi:hypothetical protein
VEAALVRGLVAQEERELLLIGDLSGGGIVAAGFEVKGALAKPVMLGHGFDERGFGERGWLVLIAEDGEELIEFGLRFGGEDAEGSGETVAQVVQGSGGFSGIAFRTGRKFCVLAVGFDLGFG